MDEHVEMAENGKRIRASILALLAGKSAKFSDAGADLTVSYSDRFNRYSGGRVALFQQLLTEGAGIMPEILGAEPTPEGARFTFSTGLGPDSDSIAIAKEALEDPDSIESYPNLGISGVEFRGKSIYPQP